MYKDSDMTRQNTDNNDSFTYKDDEMKQLEGAVQHLKREVANLISERDRTVIESKLAVEDAELARSFSKKNYASLLLELFEKPSMRLRKQSTIMFILAFCSLGALLGGYLFIYMETKQERLLIQQQLSELTNKIEQLHQKSLQPLSPAEKNNTAQHSLEPYVNADSIPSTPTDNRETVEASSELTPAQIAKSIKIAQQANAILAYIELAAQQAGFPKNYTTNKKDFAQLYLIVMQYASNENIYYEAYLDVISRLKIAPNIAPATVDDLVEMDTDFLQAAYSGFIITTKKLEKGWRYREEDQQFSTYYNNALDYDLGLWQIVNETKDYKSLPEIFRLNILRTEQQLVFNEQDKATGMPSTIYYKAYKENNKNNAVIKLLDNSATENRSGTLAISTATLAPLK
jgi:hypothetical protein